MKEGPTSAEPAAKEPLSTSRPWLSAAGCLGGSMILVVGAVILIALVVLLIFFPVPDFFGGAH